MNTRYSFQPKWALGATLIAAAMLGGLWMLQPRENPETVELEKRHEAIRKAPESMQEHPLPSETSFPSIVQAVPTREPSPTPNIAHAPKGDQERSNEIQGLVRESRLVHSTVSKYVPMKGEPKLPRQDVEWLRRTRYLVSPSFKYPHLRVDEVYHTNPDGSEVLFHEASMVADHLVVEAGSAVALASLVHDPRFSWLIEGETGLLQLASDFETVYKQEEDVLRQTMESLSSNGLQAEPDYLVFSTATTPDDADFNQLWGMFDMGAPTAWDTTTDSSSLVVGIIDTGIDLQHPDLSANIWLNPGESGSGRENNGLDDDGNGFVDDVYGWDFVADDNDPSDDHYHGTHCAGTVGAVGNNTLGVAGVAWSAQLMSLKFLDHQGRGSTSDAIRAVHYANTQGVAITSNSWGGGGYSSSLKTKIEEGNDLGFLFIAAAGNAGQDTDSQPAYPASYDCPNIISVAAMAQDRTRASFSNYGLNSVDIGAPGVAILSTSPAGSYRVLSGTSMATPHVAGAAALLWAHFTEYSSREIRALILDHAEPVPDLDGQSVTGGVLALSKIFGDFGDLRPPAYRSPALAAGADHFLYVRPDGKVLQWGGGRAVAELVAGVSDVLQVAAGNRVSGSTDGGWNNAGSLSVALKRDGTVWYWYDYGSPVPMAGMADIVEIALGKAQLLARRADGSVWTWGRSYIAQGLGDGSTTQTSVAIQVSGITDAVALAAGQSHNLVLRGNGTVLAWGYNRSGQLGDGTTTNRKTPVAVSSLSQVKSVAAGSGALVYRENGSYTITANQSLAVRTDGTVYSWGYNRYGELGYSWPSEQTTPKQVSGLSGIHSAAGGLWSSYVVGKDGRVHAFGWNGFGQLGLGDVVRRNTPTLLPNLQNVVDVTAGERIAGALLEDGSVWVWGMTDQGALGNGIIPQKTYRPVDPGLTDIVAIGAGYHGSAFVDSEGHVWETGSTLSNELYNPSVTGASTLNRPQRTSYDGVRFAPSRDNNVQYELLEDGRVRFAGSSSFVPNLSSVQMMDSRGWAGAAVRTDGALLAWGQNGIGNDYGQLGDGTTTSRSDARVVAGLPSMKTVAVGNYHMVAAAADGRVYCWGRGTSGQLGNGSSSNSPTPVQVSGLSGEDIIAVGAGDTHSLALSATGVVYAWGSGTTNGLQTTINSPGILTFPEPIVDISCGFAHSLAVGVSGKVYSWGYNSNCQLGNGTISYSNAPTEVSLISNAVAVSADKDHSIALLADSTVRCWGSNIAGQVGDGNSRRESPFQVITPQGSAPTRTLDFAAATDLNWSTSHFSESQLKNPDVSGLDADPDGDGLSNIIEYTVGSDPLGVDDASDYIRFGVEPMPTDTGVVGVTDTDAPKHAFIELQRSADVGDVIVSAEGSTNLEDWYGEREGWIIKTNESRNSIKFFFSGKMSDHPGIFLRLKFELAN